MKGLWQTWKHGCLNLKPKAWLVLHDIGWAEGVNRAIKEIVEPIAISKPIVLPNLYAVRVDYSQAK